MVVYFKLLRNLTESLIYSYVVKVVWWYEEGAGVRIAVYILLIRLLVFVAVVNMHIWIFVCGPFVNSFVAIVLFASLFC